MRRVLSVVRVVSAVLAEPEEKQTRAAWSGIHQLLPVARISSHLMRRAQAFRRVVEMEALAGALGLLVRGARAPQALLPRQVAPAVLAERRSPEGSSVEREHRVPAIQLSLRAMPAEMHQHKVVRVAMVALALLEVPEGLGRLVGLAVMVGRAAMVAVLLRADYWVVVRALSRVHHMLRVVQMRMVAMLGQRSLAVQGV